MRKVLTPVEAFVLSVGVVFGGEVYQKPPQSVLKVLGGKSGSSFQALVLEKVMIG